MRKHHTLLLLLLLLLLLQQQQQQNKEPLRPHSAKGGPHGAPRGPLSSKE